ncbi:Transcription termination factor MTEF1, chloroplastic [Linum perenne]
MSPALAATALHSSFSISSSSSPSLQAPSDPQQYTTQQLSAKPNKRTTSSNIHHSLHTKISSQIKEKVLCLEIMGVDSGKALSQNPNLHSASLDSIHSVVSFLHSKGIHHNDFPRIFGMCPNLLTSDVLTQITPVFSFLSRTLNVPDYRFRKVIIKCPRLLTASVDNQLHHCLDYLRDTVGFNQNQLESLIYSDPVLLVSSVENTLVPKVKYLESVGLEEDETLAMVRRFPPLFTFSIENNLKPKYEYFVGEMKGGLDELKEFPHYFGFSLENRIKPRYLQVLEMGVDLPLPLLLKTTDPRFKELLLNPQIQSTV